MRGAILVFIAACGSAPDLSTPENVAKNAHDGDAITVEGDVFTMTFDDTLGADQNYTALPDRWILIRSMVAPHTTLEDLDTGRVDAAWGLGIHIPGAQLATMTLPQIGDHVKVSGTFTHDAWNGRTEPSLVDATITIESPPTVLGAIGDACQSDMQCHDRLICDRDAHACAAPPEVTWDSPYHDVNGVCTTDADCSIGEHCDTSFHVAAAGDFSAYYFAQSDDGKSLCVLDATTLSAACPRIATSADVTGGRFVAGKEVCVQGTSWLSVVADDHDTHAQMALEDPLPYPAASTGYYIFGSTTENSPPYKDATRPGGALADPVMGNTYVAVGTVRYDPSHGWWEVHSVKAYFMVQQKPKTMAEMKATYPTHPGNIDIDKLEGYWGPDEADLESHSDRK